MICICTIMFLGTVCLKLYENRNVTDYSIFRYIPSKNKNDRTHIFLANTTAAAKNATFVYLRWFFAIFCCTRKYKIYSSCDRVQIYRENLQFIITSLVGLCIMGCNFAKWLYFFDAFNKFYGVFMFLVCNSITIQHGW